MKHIYRISTWILGVMMATGAILSTNAAIPVSYYNSVKGKSNSELKTALHTLIYNHTLVSSYQALPEYFKKTDVYPPENKRYGQWWDMYSDIPLYLPNFWGMHREHSFPKSWWGGSTDTPAYTDLNHLYPAEAEANLAKSNWPLGVVAKSEFNNGITKVGAPETGQGGGAAQVFEPDDEYKGDFARTYFYMATCYQNLRWKYTYMVSNNAYPTLNPWAVDLLLKWHHQDPVSQKEIDRNNEVYKVQANRNPFIDYPELADYIWGDKKGQIWFPSTGSGEPSGDPELITPVQDMELEFGQTVVNQTNTASLFFRGQNLTGELTITIYGTNKAMFKSDTKSISAKVVNSDNGYWLKVNYTPTALGQHSARLLVSDGGMPGSLGIALRGEGVEQPVLHDFKALPASNITANSYTANWEVPSNDIVDYYVVTRTIYGAGDATVEEMEAETNELDITDCSTSRESYHVRSARLGFYSEASNEIYVDLTGGLTDVAVDSPLGWTLIPGGIRIVCGDTQTNARVYDASGRLLRIVAEISNYTEIELPMGAFFIVTDQQHTPIRVLVRN